MMGGGERRVRIQMSCRDAWLWELIRSSIQAEPPGKNATEVFTGDKDNKEGHEGLLVMDSD